MLIPCKQFQFLLIKFQFLLIQFQFLFIKFKLFFSIQIHFSIQFFFSNSSSFFQFKFLLNSFNSKFPDNLSTPISAHDKSAYAQSVTFIMAVVMTLSSRSRLGVPGRLSCSMLSTRQSSLTCGSDGDARTSLATFTATESWMHVSCNKRATNGVNLLISVAIIKLLIIKLLIIINCLNY